jgi:hypothetical protein
MGLLPRITESFSKGVCSSFCPRPRSLSWKVWRIIPSAHRAILTEFHVREWRHERSDSHLQSPPSLDFHISVWKLVPLWSLPRCMTKNTKPSVTVRTNKLFICYSFYSLYYLLLITCFKMSCLLNFPPTLRVKSLHIVHRIKLTWCFVQVLKHKTLTICVSYRAETDPGGGAV